MKGLIPFIIVVAIIGGGAGYLIVDLQGKLDEAQFEAEIAKQRIKFAEQARFTIAVPDEKLRFDREQLMSWHRRAIKKVAEAHPKIEIEDRFINEMERKAAAGKRDKAKTAAFRERYDWMKGVWEKRVKKGGYEPILTQYKNGVRFDVVEISKWRPPEGGKEALKMDVLIWGPVKDQITFGSLEMAFVREIEQKVRGRTVKKKAIAKIQGGGPPTILHPSGPNPPPMDWITEWPPGVMVGYYAGLPLFAPDATSFTFKLSMQVRTQAGTTMPVELEWKNVPVDDAWRAPEGAGWDADVAEATEEELREMGL